MSAALRPLRLPGFAGLAVAYLVNELGNWLGELALAVLVFEQTGDPLATAALFCAMQFMPALLGPPLVARLDRMRPRVVLPLLYAAEAVAFTCLALLADGGFALVPVLALATFDGAIASAARALTRATAAAVLDPAGQLREGNAVLNVGFTVGAAAGPAIAGVLVAGAGIATALAIDAASFVIVAAVLGAARLPRPADEEEGQPRRGSIARLRESIAYVRARPALRGLLTAQALAFVFFALVLPIEVVFAKQTLDAGDAGYGLMLASWGTGMVAGSLLFAALGRLALSTLLCVSTFAIGLAYLGVSVSPVLATACAASAVGGLGNGIQWIALVTAVQTLTGAAQQARILALLEAIASAMPGIGFLAGGAIAALGSPRLAFAVAGAGVLAVLAVAIAGLRRFDLAARLAAARLPGTPQDAEHPATSIAGAGVPPSTPVSGP